MASTRPTKRRLLRSLARERFGLDLVALDPVIGGLDDRARVWQGVDLEGRIWSIKSTRRDCRFGLALASSLAESGTTGVVAPLVSLDGRPWIEHRGSLISVSRWIDGEDAVDAGSDQLSWESLGSTLRAVHDHRPPLTAVPIRRGIRRASLPMSLLLDDVEARLEQTTAGTTDVDSGHAAHVASLWAGARERLALLAVEERRLKAARLPAGRVALHGDPHLGNVVVDTTGRPWLIDFDESTVAPREVDLMLVELGVIFSMPVTDAQRARFRDGYGPVEIDADRIRRFGCVRAIEDATATVLRLIEARPDDRDELEVLLAGQLGPAGLVTLVERALGRAPGG